MDVNDIPGIIYLIGCCVCFVFFRHDGRKRLGDEYGYGSVLINLLFSVFSWWGAIVIFFMSDYLKLPKPPKWL